MSKHFSMGAINKLTNKYEYPKVATKEKSKNNLYKCPECEKDVIFKKGKIKQPHFSHKKSNKPCTYYDRPSETQIHLDAKMLMKALLDNKMPISFHRYCDCCEQKYNILNIDTYNDSCEAIIEYKFNYNGSRKSADVALIENNNIKYIFEICHTNKTKVENRPEPWVEIDAETLLNNMNQEQINNEIECIRYYKCEICIFRELEQIERNKEFMELEKMRIEEMRQKKYELDEKIEKNRIQHKKIHIEYLRQMRDENLKIKLENEKIEKERELIEKEKIRLMWEEENNKIKKENVIKKILQCECMKNKGLEKKIKLEKNDGKWIYKCGHINPCNFSILREDIINIC
jgi:hypothetical protein